MTPAGWTILALVVAVLAFDWFLVAAASKFERRVPYDDLDEADGTHDVRFDEEEDSK